MKLLLSFVSTPRLIAPNGKNVVVLTLICSSCLLAKRFVSCGYSCIHFNEVSLVRETVVWWISLNSTVFLVIFSEASSFVETILFLPIVAAVFLQLYELQIKQILSRGSVYCTNINEQFFFISIVADLIRKKDEILLEGVLKKHIIECRKPIDQCCCRWVEKAAPSSQANYINDRKDDGDDDDEENTQLNEIPMKKAQSAVEMMINNI